MDQLLLQNGNNQRIKVGILIPPTYIYNMAEAKSACVGLHVCMCKASTLQNVAGQAVFSCKYVNGWGLWYLKDSLSPCSTYPAVISGCS